MFIIAFGVLITIHELGHLITAKMFKVYCSDFSIGFGYKILKIVRDDPDEKKNSLFWFKSKNKKRETNFSIGIVPLGGYVAMLDADEDETIKVKPELKGRSVEDITYWKKIIVFLAGVFMNFVLAWLIFFISASCFEQKKADTINVVMTTNSAALKSSVTLDEEGLIPFEVSSPTLDSDHNLKDFYVLNVNKYSDDESIYSINNPEYPVTISGNLNKYSLIFDSSKLTLNNTDYSNCFTLALAEAKTSGTIQYFPVLNDAKTLTTYTFSKDEKISTIKAKITKHVASDLSQENKTISTDVYLHLTLDADAKLKTIGFGVFVNSYWNGWNSFAVATNNWAKATDLIGKTLFRLFYDSSTWNSVGGPVAIFTQTTSILTDYPFYVYLNTWAVISVNLAIFNLLPFPGLDGWQVLVCLIEWVVNGVKGSKKNKNKEIKRSMELTSETKEVNVGEKRKADFNCWKFPPKVKNVISYIGLGLLFIVAILIFVKDVMGLF